MASSAGKTSQSPVGACNGTAIADLASAEQEQYDYQMHTKMCKKIAQLTKVIYSLNTKNEEQEATLQSLRRVAIETQGSLQPTTAQEIEDEEESSFILRTRLLELQAAIEEVEERGQKAEMEHAELVALMSQETSDLRREFQSLQAERETQHKLLQKAQEEKRQLEIECRELQEVKKKEEEERKMVETEKRREDEEEKRKYQGECEGRIENLKKELQIMKEEKERAEKEWKSETKEWSLKVKRIEEEQETSRTTLQQSLDEHISQWQQRETENRKFQNATLQQRLRKAESDLEVGEQRLNDSSRRCGKLQERVEELEEAMDEGRRRVNEAEGVAKKAEEELLVAKERLLLQENELQSKSEELMSQSSCQVRVSAEVEELRSQLGRLNIRNKELELQNSGRSNDHARMLKQHADTLSSMRLELQRAHTEEIRRLQQEVENERTKDKLELEEQKKQLQQKMEEEKAKLKEQLRKALEEVIRKHAGEVRHVHALLDAEKTRMLQVEEQIKASGDERTVLEKEREDLRNQLQLSSSEIAKLEVVIERLEREQEEDREMAKEREKERAEAQRQTACGLECVQVREELQKTQEEAAEQKEALQAEISVLQHERDLLQQSNHSTEEKMRLQFEKQFSDQMLELKREKEDEVRKMNQQWQQKVEELQTLLDEKKEKAEGEKERERRYGHGEMERMKQEIQKTRDMNSSLRAQLHSTIQEKERLMQQQLQVVKEEDEEDEEEEKRGWHEREELLRTERLNHQRAIQALETQADEELQSERQRLITQHKLQLDKQKAELTQQHTEWVRQVTQRHMQQIEDLQNEIHTHTQMMALQQDLKQQNRLQSLERQLDEKNSEVQELKRENEDLKANSLRKEHDEQKHKSICESLEAEGSLRWSNMESVKKEREREHRLEIQTMMSDFNTAQTRLQARIVALETELKEREERGKRRVEDLHTIAKLQDKLSEREQLIKSLMEDLHQLSQHPPLSSNETLKPYDCRTPVGTLTPPAKKKAVDDTIVVDRGPSLTRTQTPTSPHTDRRASVRHSRPPSQELRHQTQLQLKTSYNQHIRTPAEQRVLESDSQKQEWFTKYFSF